MQNPVASKEQHLKRDSVLETLYLESFLDDATRGRILREMETAASVPAGVYGRGPGDVVETRTRSAQRLTVSMEVRRLVEDLLRSVQTELAEHFGQRITMFEEPQFLRYVAGDFFVAHQDGNTSLTRDDSRSRRISIVMFLNSQSVEPREGTYGSGSLVLHGSYPAFGERHVVPATAGGLVAFRSETTHEVLPVTHGERHTIVSWFRV